MLDILNSFLVENYNLIFHGFIYYIFSMLFLQLITKDKIFFFGEKIDKIVSLIFSFTAFLFILIWLFESLKYQSYFGEQIAFHKRSLGQLWVIPVFYPLFIHISCQFLWIPSFRRSIIFRMILVLIILLIPMLERFVILSTSFHLNSLSSEHSIGIPYISWVDSITILFTFIGITAFLLGIKYLLDKRKST